MEGVSLEILTFNNLHSSIILRIINKIIKIKLKINKIIFRNLKLQPLSQQIIQEHKQLLHLNLNQKLIQILNKLLSQPVHQQFNKILDNQFNNQLNL